VPKLLVGDFNAYAQEDPMRALYAAAGAMPSRATEAAASVFLRVRRRRRPPRPRAARRRAAPRLRGAEEWHVNADEAAYFDEGNENSPGPWRASDHDPSCSDSVRT
jgi:predicted extracellular nuclease